ncbi:MAG: hypothetical protein GW856_02745 [Cyanobacteria bacterium]|nr:hypothetical protein [Cyanobacteria bacterium CG_2015-16_32_12]
MISSDFYTWLLDNQCLFNHERFKPFIDNCIEDLNLFELNSEEEIFTYLSVNGYGEETIMSFLRLWDCYQNSKEWAV